LILDLDNQGCLDPRRVGSKAARLARGRRAGLPILPGLVVEATASRGHMALGASALKIRGSGGARMAIAGEPIPNPEELVSAGSRLGSRLVARSSTGLEGSGAWSGAFASYLDLSPFELPRGVVGCWASAFSVAALDRQRRASIEPGSFLMAVLIQPALTPEAGGTAEIESSGAIVIHGIKGAPAPLLQGWISGAQARTPAGKRAWAGEELIDLVGHGVLDSVANGLQEAHQQLGANRCEWALEGETWLLQLDSASRMGPAPRPPTIRPDVAHDLVRVVRAVTRAPGKLGEDLVLPWALAGLAPTGSARRGHPQTSMAEARQLTAELTAEVWGLPPDEALQAAQDCMRDLRGPDPSSALDRLGGLKSADPDKAATLMSLIDALRTDMVERGAVTDRDAAWHLSAADIEDISTGKHPAAALRVGVGPWEPLVASVVLAVGSHQDGTPASAGVGAGAQSWVDDPETGGTFSPRRVVTAGQPISNLAALLWDAAGLVTETGGPAAHLFESARALRVPAVCGVRLPRDGEHIVAVDGHTGLVATLGLKGNGDG
jgi:hypothetical protein